MNKMTGIILMIGGVLLFVIGIIAFNTSKSKEVKSSVEMEKIVEMAAADGVLTDNERKYINENAEEQGLDGQKIIAKGLL